jgi:hypothetical protein
MMRATLVLATIVVATGCGRLRFDDLRDASPSDPGCTLGPWSSPRALTEISSTGEDYGPWLSADRLTVLFSSDRSGTFEIMIAQRATVQSPFDAPTLIPLGASSYGDPYLSADGLTLWIDSEPATTILRSTRASTTDSFGLPVVETELATGDDEYNPSLSLDQLRIGFDNLQSPQIIYLATRGSAVDTFNAPQPTPSLDVAEQNCCVSFSGDGTFVLLASDLDTPNVLHIYQAADHGDGTFGQPVEFAPTLVDSDGTQDSDPYITPGGDAVIFASLRAPNLGGFDLFETDRECL